MSKRKRTRLKIGELLVPINIHRRKIEAELAKSNPDPGAIHHWEAELNAHLGRVQRLERRLGIGRKKR